MTKTKKTNEDFLKEKEGVEGVDYTKDEDGTLTVMSSTPLVLDGYLSSWAQYTILLKDKEERDFLQSKLKENQIIFLYEGNGG